MAFKSLKLNETILKALAEQGYHTPTPIQAKAIPPILEGKDVLGCAQTGTGKTAAFALPIIQRLQEMPVDKARRGPAHPRALILSPTRELAAQIGESFATYGRHAGLSHTVIFGGVSQFHQVKAIHRGVDILVATPGRLMDLMDQRIVTLKDVKIFVLDEADRMLDMGFIQPIRRIASQVPGGRQTLLFSATMPKEIMHLADSLLKHPVKVAVNPVASAAPLIEQSVYMVPFHNKQALLEVLLEEPGVERALVFTRTKHGADRVCKRLDREGIPAVAIHGNKAQNYRIRALDAFRSGKARVLVATDVAARGLDIDNVTHVFNFDLPMEPEAYVHRIGRTGRAGATGIAIAFCDKAEFDLLRQIERLTGKTIPKIDKLPVLPSNDHQRDERAGRGDDFRERRAHPTGRGGRFGGGRPSPRPEHRTEHRTERGHAPAHSNGSRPARSPALASHAPHSARPPHPHKTRDSEGAHGPDRRPRDGQAGASHGVHPPAHKGHGHAAGGGQHRADAGAGNHPPKRKLFHRKGPRPMRPR
jgi:ATP-dependent RNA helicase RhlE